MGIWVVRVKPKAILGLATGSTPVQLYKEMIKWHKEQGLDFSQATTFNLDEYVGLAADHHASHHRFMKENLFDEINVPAENIHIPDGLTEDLSEHCEAYEQWVRDAGGIDQQVLGIGSDGHLGVNEPTSSFASHTRIKTLDEQTVEDNQRFFKEGEEVPRHVITMGLGRTKERIAKEGFVAVYAEWLHKLVGLSKKHNRSMFYFADVIQEHPELLNRLPQGAFLVIWGYYPGRDP